MLEIHSTLLALSLTSPGLCAACHSPTFESLYSPQCVSQVDLGVRACRSLLSSTPRSPREGRDAVRAKGYRAAIHTTWERGRGEGRGEEGIMCPPRTCVDDGMPGTPRRVPPRPGLADVLEGLGQDVGITVPAAADLRGEEGGRGGGGKRSKRRR